MPIPKKLKTLNLLLINNIPQKTLKKQSSTVKKQVAHSEKSKIKLN